VEAKDTKENNIDCVVPRIMAADERDKHRYLFGKKVFKLKASEIILFIPFICG
jgi:hypothetical protein